MKFDVLSRHCDIHRHYLLEASAGTGKTYSIENVVARLLIEPAPGSDQPLALEQILVVTFTRIATRDLKERVRGNLEKARTILSQESFRSVPDYLLAIVEQGEPAIQKALKQIEQALFTFDQAQIFTIHGFCSRMLRDFAFEGDLGLQIKADEEGLARSRSIEAMKDFLRTELNAASWSPAQIAKILSKHLHDVDKLCSKLLKASARESELLPFSEYVRLFAAIMADLKERAITRNKIIEDFQNQPFAYKQIDKVNLAEALKSVERFASLFDKEAWEAGDLEELIQDNFFGLRALNPEERGTRRNASSSGRLHNLFPILFEAFAPLRPCADPRLLLHHLAQQARQHFNRFQEEEEALSFDGLLSSMRRAVDNTAFAGQVRARYRVAIIDEFQDTDPIQWEIFSHLFLNGGHRLYLVGDPKQAIYAFRNADIYTYLEAAQALGSQHHAALDTNYRSTPGLVKGLNQLFSKTEGWITLPRTSSTLPYRPVAAGKADGVRHDDAFGSIHICFTEESEEAEQRLFFPFIAQEILRLKIGLEGWAVLVKDRYQGARLAHYLKGLSIPVVKQKQEHLANSPALSAFREIIEAVLQPKDVSLVKRALGSPLIGMTHDQLLALQSEPGQWEKVLERFLNLRKRLMEEGLSGFFPAFLESHWCHQSTAEHLLSREEGEELYDDLCQIVERVFSRQTTESLLHTLRSLEDQDEEDEQGIKRLQNPDRKGVHIMTLHASKGLEFEVVFPLGLISETKPPDDPQDIAECDAEKMRQLYVAMTRAKSRLYLPVLFSGKDLDSGKGSPMQLFLKALHIHHPSDLEALKSDEVSVAPVPSGIINSRIQDDPPCSLLFSGLSKLQHPVQMVSSYSSLLHQEKEPFFPTFKVKRSSEEKNVHTLPAGSEMGNLLHAILEKVSLEELSEATLPKEVVPLIVPHIQGEEFSAWHEVLAEIVFNAFHTPLPLLNGPTPLIATDPLKHFRETEFLYSWESSLNLNVEHVPGFLKGVIDLLFEHEGKYYLLDWKSNKLGERAEDYQRGRMEEAMREGGYFLQAKVYSEALRRYLKLVDPGSFEEKFGGILYLFLRGLDPSKTEQQGIYLCLD
ncbi:MAG: UvrD-helicase domain-containing protein [Parachlamydia sp.]|nr:UvrD-helicase domain-containing protein [Parachlamydia sp.]